VLQTIKTARNLVLIWLAALDAKIARKRLVGKFTLGGADKFAELMNVGCANTLTFIGKQFSVAILPVPLAGSLQALKHYCSWG
jgi:hypothetical protein